MEKLKNIQKYLEEKGIDYQVSVYFYEDGQYTIGILNNFIENDILIILVNKYKMSLQDGFIWGVFEI